MNTLPTAIKSRLFTNKTEYLSMRAHWSRLMNSERKHELAAAHHLLYLALTGRDWRKGFTPVSNQWKLVNGAFTNWRLFTALRALHSRFHEDWLLEPFDGLVTPAMVQQIREWVPQIQVHQCEPEDFFDGSYPFDAYRIHDTVEALDTDEVESMQ